MKRLLLTVATAATLGTSGVVPSATAETELTLGRFFGACEEAGTDPATAVGEACIIQSIINAFSEADNGITVVTLPTEWDNYYDQIKTTYAGGNPPDVHVMHRHRVLEFATLGAIAPLTEDLAGVNIDTSDWADLAVAAVTHGDDIYAVPFDFHATLWHVNMDIMEEAGLVNDDGTLILPTSPEEMIEQAKAVKEKTGKDYLASDFSVSPMGIRVLLAWIWQQNQNIFEGDAVTLDTDATRAAIKTLTDLIDGGYVNEQFDYANAQQAFLDGDVAILANGTWVVDFYAAQAADPSVPLANYHVTDFPTIFETPATWADTHMWAVPASLKANDPEKYQAALQLLAWINENNAAWAKTGHMAVRKSVLESDAYANLPHRADYSGTADIARDVPPSVKYGAIQDTLVRELQAIWLTDKSVDDALSDAEQDIQDLL